MAGIGSSIVSLLVYWIAFPTYGLIVYPKLATFPAWAFAHQHHPVNATLVANATKAVLNATLNLH